MAVKTKTPPTGRKSRETMPLRVQRSGIISHRVRRVFWIVQSMRDKPYTRNKFSRDLENVLGDAVHEFCRWLYAEANGRRKEARRCWDDVQQMVEYELPLVILHAKKACKTRRGREKVINATLPLVLTKAIPMAKLCEDLEYKNFETASPRRRVKRPDKNRFGEFCPWVKDVIAETLDHEEMVDAYDKRDPASGLQPMAAARSSRPAAVKKRPNETRAGRPASRGVGG